MKCGSKDHIKVKRLKRALGVPLFQAVGVLETLYQVCVQSADDGGIGRYTNADIAIELEWDGDPDQLVQALKDSGLVDDCNTNRLTVHDWLDHAPDFIKDRLRKRTEKSSDPRSSSGNSDSDRNCPGDSALTKANQTKPNQLKPNHASGRSRNRSGALTSLMVEDLRDSAKVLQWFANSFPNRQSQDAQLFALAAAQAALRGGDPPALFVFIVSKDSRDSVKQTDWDEASRLLKKLKDGS